MNFKDYINKRREFKEMTEDLQRESNVRVDNVGKQISEFILRNFEDIAGIGGAIGFDLRKTVCGGERIITASKEEVITAYDIVKISLVLGTTPNYLLGFDEDDTCN